MYDSRIKSKDSDILAQAFLSLENEEEFYMFIEDLCTLPEITSFVHRMKVATLLREGKTCLAISQETGASTATISRVNKCLQYGTGGYDYVLDKLK